MYVHRVRHKKRFRFEEDDEEDSDGEGRDSFIPNVEFEPLRNMELIDPSLSNWVHYYLYFFHISSSTQCFDAFLLPHSVLMHFFFHTVF